MTRSTTRRDGVAALNPLPRLTSRRAAALFADETGAATAEYAIATMRAVLRCTRQNCCRGPRSQVTGPGLACARGGARRPRRRSAVATVGLRAPVVASVIEQARVDPALDPECARLGVLHVADPHANVEECQQFAPVVIAHRRQACRPALSEGDQRLHLCRPCGRVGLEGVPRGETTAKVRPLLPQFGDQSVLALFVLGGVGLQQSPLGA